MSETKQLSIDEQLAAEQTKFDQRLKAEAKAELPEGAKVVIKPKAKVRPPQRRTFQPGEVAHVHYRETDTDMLEIPCKYVLHNVRDKKGFMINDTRYRGKVVVPQCTANYLSMMEHKHREMEHGVFEDRGRKVNYGEIRG